MATAHPHSKLISAAAREVLRPLGLVRKGRSRTWLDDQGWWLGVVEFQPSAWSRGSYLNVGVNWLWNEKDYLSFDYGHRVAQSFIEYEDDEQFRPLAQRLAMKAAVQVAHYRQLFPTVEEAAHALRPTEAPLPALDAGVALGLSGDAEEARAMFAHYTHWYESETDSEYLTEIDRDRYQRTLKLLSLVDGQPRFADEIRAEVAAARMRLKLPSTHLPF